MPPASPNLTGQPRRARRSAILALVQGRAIHSQQELRRLLAARGMQVNQATLSRDMRDMGLVKGPLGYAVPGAPAAAVEPATGGDPDTALALLHAARQWLVSAVTAQNQVVLKTPAGGAQPLAVAVDRAGMADVVGTVGGDDTVLVIAPSAAAARRLQRRLLALRGGER